MPFGVTLDRKESHPVAWWLATIWVGATLLAAFPPADVVRYVGKLGGGVLFWFIFYYVFAGIGIGARRIVGRVRSVAP